MSTIGRYNLLVSDNGQYAVEWHSSNQRHVIVLPHLIDKIHEMVQNEMVIRQHFAEIFHLAFSENSNAFIDHPDSIIMNYLNDNETMPNVKMGKEDLFEFNVKRLLLAYNRWKGTSIKYYEVESLCR